MAGVRGQISVRVATAGVALRRLRRWLPADVARVLEELNAHGARVFVVGGAVRDALLGRGPASDWDLATDAKPGQVASWFSRVVRAGEKHGTIGVLTAGGPVEVTTFRAEGPYLDGRRPSRVEFLDDLDADLARRDFTVNAMAADLERGNLVDPFGGRDDLEKRVIRCVGDPAVRFAEDGLRPLRALRLAASLGFRLEPRTRAALAGALATFERVAWERKRDELTRLLAAQGPMASVLAELDRSGLLASLAPELCATPARVAKAVEDTTPSPWLRFAVWAAGVEVDPRRAGDILRRWRVASREVKRVEHYVRSYYALGRTAPVGAGLRRFLAAAGAEAAPEVAEMASRLKPRAFGRIIESTRRALAAEPPLTLRDLAVQGDDLVAAGVSGPQIGRTLAVLLDCVLDRPSRNRRELLLRMVGSLSTGKGSPQPAR